MQKIILLCCVLSLVACQKKKVVIPPDVLSEEQMVAVLIDVHILEAKVRRLYLAKDSSQKVYRHYEGLLFEEKGISKEEYVRSLDFYVGEIDKLSKVYNQVLDSLLSRQKSHNFN